MLPDECPGRMEVERKDKEHKIDTNKINGKADGLDQDIEIERDGERGNKTGKREIKDKE